MSNQTIAAEINAALGAHGAWKLRLVTAIRSGRFDGDAAAVSCDNQCAFGQWLYGDTIPAPIREGKPYQVVRRLHAEFHECAGQVVAKITAGRTGEAEAIMNDEYAVRSETLNRALTKWRRELMTASFNAAA